MQVPVPTKVVCLGEIKVKILSTGIFLLGTLVFGGTLQRASADTLVLQDGSTRTGTVVKESPEFIVFRDPSMGEMRIPAGQIRQLTKTDANPAAATAENTLAYARAEAKRGQVAEALQHYIQAAQSGVTPELAQEFRTYFNQVYTQASEQLKSTPDQARTSLKGLYQALGDPKVQPLFTTGGSAADYNEAGANTGAKLAEADFQMAQRMQNNTALRPQTLDLLRESVALTQNTNPQYLLAYGDVARESGDMDTAFSAYKALVESGRANQDQLNSAYEKLNRIAVATNNRLRMNYATPAPTVTPAPPVAPAIAYAPPVAPAIPAAAPTGPPQPAWRRLLESVKSGAIFSEATTMAKSLLGPDILALAGVALGALLVLWVLPYQLLKFLARHGDQIAGDRLFRAKRWGLASLVVYAVQKLKEKKAIRHRCPFCNKGIDNMEDYKDFNFVICPHCREPITPIYNMQDYIDHLIAQLKQSQRASKGQKGDHLVEKDAMLKLVRGVLALAVRRRASDFHLETLNEGGKVRARIDGIMYDLITLPREITPAFISAIKVMAQLDITERRVPQDGKIALWIDQKDYDLRVNTSPASMGEKVVIRILRQDFIAISPDRLGLDGENLSIFERNIHKPHGVIIVTGPSGSGKSTSLYVALNQLNSGDKNIVTIEDPIEYHLQGLSQMQVNPAANFTFANGLRSILRQDPDVIMVGEIRDKETAEAALDAAMTGHLVLTTLHTIDAPSAFSRMKDLGIEQVRVANAVNLVIAQRLVRTLCPDCRKGYSPKAADLEKLGLSKDDSIKFVHGTGCETCSNTGYYGRLAIYEMLELNEDIRTLLETNTPTTTLREAAKRHGLHTLREEGIRKVREGLTTVEEVIRVTTE